MLVRRAESSAVPEGEPGGPAAGVEDDDGTVEPPTQA
jgi:hypothetical protein